MLERQQRAMQIAERSKYRFRARRLYNRIPDRLRCVRRFLLESSSYSVVSDPGSYASGSSKTPETQPYSWKILPASG